MDSPELQAAKQDGAYLRRVLRVERDDQHALCPLCNKRNMTVGPDKKGSGSYLWICGSGCGNGTIVDALMKVEGKSIKDAMAEIFKEYGDGKGHAPKQYRELPNKPPPEIKYGKQRPDPVLNMAMAQEFVDIAHGWLMDHLDIPTRFKRGISAEIIKRYKIGFIENVPHRFRPDSKNGWLIPAAWVLPVTDDLGKLKGVKLHFEIRPKLADGSPCEGKSRWAAFGTEPAFDKEKNITSNHSYYTLWPHPNTLEDYRVAEEFSSDVGWWVSQIPDGELKDRWYKALEWARYDVAFELGKSTDDLDGGEGYSAIEKAFETMRDDIHRAVSKTQEKTKLPEISEEETEIVEPLEWQDYIFLCPGELKAFAVLSAGFRATAVTGGESWIPSPELLESLKGYKIVIFYDDDPPRLDTQGRVRCAGKEWAKHMAAALARHGVIDILLKSGGLRDVETEEESEVPFTDNPA